MLKLILTDLKVLGNKVWIVPTGVYLMTVIAAFLTRNFKDSSMFINALIVPVIFVILSYSLMHYSEKSRLQREMGSLPCRTKMLVFEKYIMVLIFLFISFAANTAYVTSVSIFRGLNFDDILTVSHITTMMILTMSLFAIPLFFRLDSAIKAYFGTFVWISGLGTIFGTVLVKLYPFDDDIDKNILILIVLLSLNILYMAIMYFKNRKSVINYKQLLLFPIATILPATAFSSILTVTDIINQTLLYNFMLPGYKRMFFGDSFPDYIAEAYRVVQVNYQAHFLLLNGITSVILTAAAVYLWKKQDTKKIMNDIAFFLIVPIILLSVVIAFFLFVYIVEIIISGNKVRISLDDAYLISFYCSLIPLFLVSFHYSKKFLSEGGK